MMRQLQSAEQDGYQLAVGECDCGYHFSADASFLEEIGDFQFACPSCGVLIDTELIFTPNGARQG
jgi:hypothetical protein